ncbi:FAD-binding oxidoreductase [Sinorhizobium medicae]|uniref:NAD(P)/FAD-dependent oxidoreductase n=1 Tax=Sinorhizobium medicae TaxID=110321 RepID=UPI000417E585|nr:FAD-dependent oxidoreductase [Sinorhizobium medicae]MDX0528856.1 FAD-dependent oxidoreductase [Sinorhizobium medicae]MQX96493.1 FAD-dependent oxidoreductase [Sinorhizobium medicae]RVJ63946.1 FAD-binding oxidoreductase [Sinorhizobium medicae]RVJ76530.1 FAD-binding oxidoreductase [Sinorhizobium medicae]RVQ59531.1 FAD-binding oxidoreductase [Sinorhizobium medicae]
MPLLDDCDIAVVGGGLVGAALAWGLARTGLKTMVLDGGDLDPRASRANFALVWVQGKGLHAPHYALWSKASAERWPTFAAALAADSGIDVALSQRGAFSFALSQGELGMLAAELETIAAETNGAAAPYEILTAEETRRRLPLVGQDVVGAAYSPADGHVNSLRLFHALHTAMRHRGVDYRACHAVERIEPVDAGFRLAGAFGTIFARRIVLAAGIDNQRLAAMVGLHAPLKHSKGQILVTEKCRPLFEYTSATIRQADEGGVMIGDSEETHTTAIATNQEISAVLANRAVRVFPCLAELNVVRSWAGFRVKTRDGLPIYAQSASHPGAFIAVCHSGVTLAANHALVVAPQIAGGALSSDLAPFHSGRFHVSENS